MKRGVHSTAIEAQRQPKQWVGIYKTRAAAQRGRQTMLERGVPEHNISLLAADGGPGPVLSAARTSRAPLTAWLGLLAGSTLGGLAGVLLGRGTLEVWGLEEPVAAWWISGTIFAFGFGLIGATLAALAGLRTTADEAAFHSPSDPRTGTALGVVTESAQQAVDVDDAYETSGAVDVHAEPARILPLAA